MFDGNSLTPGHLVCLMVSGSRVVCFLLFCLDGLLEALSVGCHWGGYFAGAVCYADDIVLLAPSASALQHMLHICESFASSHGLLFNASKTQLICFHSPG